jgi:hypothetical protein
MDEDLDLIFTSGLMSRLLTFVDYIIPPIDYFENENYTIVFKKGEIYDRCGKTHNILAFLVVDKDDRLEEYLNLLLIPLLEVLLRIFKSQSNLVDALSP